ncbi:hypothetical protein A3D80_00455 [Candidatus Roizmanbacteria bacterium RIFCSPHIGHO2_02_FULL_40_13b]|uniref:Uncharacterized protein n=1 Tax=Candidatus Roizmanbacteria bacterium RIFCSPHIGHO2_01_FULL_39_24 TaxID=1802032 RepID=A0A1F7GKB5_9BACT|nr:MAG: hypothetical protein A2799_02420 [Candidatus Roizmanbacteria bacterium RIFCSPHIGHO2_01_FULL_39_24]OGK27418.1 MAG: hypothetical protein A3D80_00455 [Candidatus Roizmanbacteria bacterium RIFCSPHIGHO2_02_FULL_40_13b]OGK50437.1 MAG: hypothetical protein A3A56_02295 [Candidatus Roizmanbacteria bacterium RIFCSPLOWO2_01_FULL_40_32]OGK56394.1 MAG: hypothetical protein A3H83_01095 [Candidatus Roizmanbacteria bacterium RIFCSPLOWO2_02_FULL_39_8]
MVETDTTSPENGIIPKDKKGVELWEWLKKLLKQAAAKLARRDVPEDDPDKKAAKAVLKNIQKITEKIKEEAAERGESETIEEVDKKFPPKIREAIEALHVEDFIDNHYKDIVPILGRVAEGALGIDAAIAEIGIYVAHRTGLDKRIGKAIASKLINKVKDAKLRLELGQRREDKWHVEEAEKAIEKLTQMAEADVPPPERPREKEERQRRPSRSEEDIATLKTRLEDRMSTKDLEWFDTIRDPEEFARHYQEEVRKLMNPDEAAVAKGKVAVSADKAREMVSEEATKFVMNSLMAIYSPILDEEPREFFEKQAQNAGNFQDNPQNAAQVFSTMLNGLKEQSKIKSADMSLEPDVRKSLKEKQFRRLEKRKSVVLNDQSGQLEEAVLAATELGETDISDFAEYLREVLETGQGTIEFGHNFKLLTTLGPKEGREGPESFFKQIGGYAEGHFTADRIDTAFRLPYNDVVQASKQKFQSSYARLFLENGWQKDPRMLERFLESMPAAERRVKDELREQFGEETPEWAINWAFHMGRTMYFGLDFGFHEMVSWADPNLKYDGSSTLTGSGYMRGYFDMFETAKMTNTISKDKHLAEAVWLPYTIDMTKVKYDSTEWTKIGRARWNDSFAMGRMGFADSFLDGQKQFIDLGNITKVGGWGTNTGWRVREGYNTWLMPEFKGNTEDKLDIDPKGPDGDRLKFVNSWKRVENIGIPIVENFMQQYIINKTGDMPGKTNPPEFVEAVQSLGDFFFDRYFSDGGGTVNDMGRQLLDPDLQTKEALRKYIGEILTKDVYIGSRQDRLIKILNHVSTVMTFEQLPAHFITMEKQRMTEYGVTLFSQVQGDFLAKEGGSGHEKDAKERADKALANLIYVQEKLRIDASAQMEKIQDTPHKNLYGDLDSLKSSVMGGKGVMVDEKYIRDILETRFAKDKDMDEAERKKLIQDTVEVYATIKKQIVKPPDMDDIRRNKALAGLETKDKKRFEAVEKKVTEGKVKSRAAWWSSALTENVFGHSVSQPSVAMKFINVAAAGPDIVKRDAEQAADCAETLHTRTTELYHVMKEGAKAARDKGPQAGYEPLAKWIGSLKQPIQKQLNSEIAYMVDFRAAQLINMFFKNDDDANKWWKLQPQRYWANFKQKSVSGRFIDPGEPIWSWNKDTEAGWAEYLYRDGKLKRDPPKGLGVKYTEVDNNLTRRVLQRIPIIGRGIKGKKMFVRDHINTFTYRDLKSWSNSDWREVLKHNYLPAFILALIALGVISAKKGSEDIKVT